jgi:hypothetical protein
MVPPPKIRIHHPRMGALILREGLSIRFYLPHSHPDIARQVRRALEDYLLTVGRRALAWYPDPNGDWRELDESGWKVVQHKLRDEVGGPVELAEKPDAVSSYQFEYWGRFKDPARPHDICALSFWLPTEFMEAHGADAVRALALKLGAHLPFSSGHAGLAFHRLGATRELSALCARYPGLDVSAVSHLSWNLGTRLNGIHWMNFLGPPVLTELGGADALRARLEHPGTTVEALDAERALITLGAWPEAGDTSQGHSLPAYAELARVLEPWLHHDTRGWDDLTPEELRRWERRFLD